MRWIVTEVVVALILVACKGEFVVESTGEPYLITESESCNKAGYCSTCSPGFDGKMKCEHKFSSFCSGTKRVSIEVTPTFGYYEKDPEVLTKKLVRKKVKELSPCL